MDENTSANTIPDGELDITDWSDVPADTNEDDGEAQEEANPLEPDAETSAKEPTAPTESATPETITSEKQAETDNSFELKHLGEVKKVNKDEIIVLAQKGLDYDRVKGNQDERLAFLDDLALRSGITVKELMENARTKFDDDAISAIAEKESCSIEVAKRLYNAEIKEAKDKATAAAADKQKQDAESAALKAEEAHKADMKEFLTEYPEIAPESIKDIAEIWDMVKNGKPLVDAYRAYENKQLKAEREALKKNIDNKSKSTGSKATAGNKTETSDPWLRDLESRF